MVLEAPAMHLEPFFDFWVVADADALGGHSRRLPWVQSIHAVAAGVAAARSRSGATAPVVFSLEKSRIKRSLGQGARRDLQDVTQLHPLPPRGQFDYIFFVAALDGVPRQRGGLLDDPEGLDTFQF